MSIYTRNSADISPDGRFRFLLTREWDLPRERTSARTGGRCCFIMLNPSTADAKQDDPTIRRCVDFARRWGHEALDVVNLFALRTPHPRELLTAPDLLGPRDQAEKLYADVRLIHAAAKARTTVAAWGVHGAMHGRDRVVLELLRGIPLFALGLTAGGQPRHPLYIPAHTQLIPFTHPEPAEQPRKAVSDVA